MAPGFSAGQAQAQTGPGRHASSGGGLDLVAEVRRPGLLGQAAVADPHEAVGPRGEAGLVGDEHDRAAPLAPRARPAAR